MIALGIVLIVFGILYFLNAIRKPPYKMWVRRIGAARGGYGGDGWDLQEVTAKRPRKVIILSTLPGIGNILGGMAVLIWRIFFWD